MRGEGPEADWPLVIAITVFVAAGAIVADPRLRFHSIAVSVSAFVWAVTTLALLPWLAASHSSEPDYTQIDRPI